MTPLVFIESASKNLRFVYALLNYGSTQEKCRSTIQIRNQMHIF